MLDISKLALLVITLLVLCPLPSAAQDDRELEAILSDLKKGDSRTCFRRLWRLASPKSKDLDRDSKKKLSAAVRPLLKHTRANCRYAAVKALSYIDKNCTELLIASTKDSSNKVRHEALWSLQSIGPLSTPTIAAIRLRLLDSDKNVRQAALRILHSHRKKLDTRFVEVLESMDNWQGDRKLHLELLTAHGLQSRQALLDLLPSLSNSQKTWALMALCEFPILDARAQLSILKDSLDSKRLPLKIAAVKALPNFGVRAAGLADELTAILDHSKDPKLKLAALDSLVKIAPNDQVLAKHLAVALDDPDPKIVEAAVTQLGSCGASTKPYLPTIAKLLTHSSKDLQTATIKAVTKLGQHASALFPSFIETFANLKYHNLAIYDAFPKLSGPAFAKNLIEAYQSSDNLLLQFFCLQRLLAHSRQDLEEFDKLDALLFKAFQSTNRSIKKEAAKICLRVSPVSTKLLAELEKHSQAADPELAMICTCAVSLQKNDFEPLKPLLKRALYREKSRGGLILKELSAQGIYLPEVLQHGLKSPFPKARQNSIKAICSLGRCDDWIMKRVSNWLDKERPTYIATVYAALKVLPEISLEVRQQLVDKFVTPGSFSRKLAAQCLNNQGTRAKSMVLERLAAMHPRQIDATIQTSFFASAEAYRPLLSRWAVYPSANLRKETLFQLADFNKATPWMRKMLVKGLEDPDAGVRGAAWCVLDKFEIRPASLQTKARVDAQSEDVVLQAFSLSWLVESPIPDREKAKQIEFLESLQKSPRANASLLCRYGLSKLTGDWESHRSEVLACLYHPDLDTRYRAAWIIYKVKDSSPEVLEALQYACRAEKNPQIIAALILAAVQRKDFKSLEILAGSNSLGQSSPMLYQLTLLGLANKAEASAFYDSENPKLRELFCKLCQNSGPLDKRALAALNKLLSDPYQSVRKQALIAFSGCTAEASNIPRLMSYTKAPDMETRTAAFLALSRFGPEHPEALNKALEAFEDSSDVVRSAVYLGLFNPPPEKKRFAAAMCSALSKEKSVVIRHTITESLANYGLEAQPASAFYVKAMAPDSERYNDNATSTRRLILSGVTFPELLPQLQAALHERYPDHQRCHALLTFAALGDKAVHSLETIKPLSKSESTQVRFCARFALAWIQGKQEEALKLTKEAFKETDDIVKVRALLASSIMGPKASDCVELIKGQLEDPWWNIRYAAVEALGYIGSAANSALPMIEDLSSDENRSVRFHAMKSLKAIKQGVRRGSK